MNKVTLVNGHARLSQGKKVKVMERGGKKVLQTLDAENIIMASGSSPAQLASAPLKKDYIVDSARALAFDSVPKRLGVIGAGVIGLELGSVWKRLGAEVTILEAMDQFLVMAVGQIAREGQRGLVLSGRQ